MQPILADSIDGGILAILIVFGGLATAALALIALVPAWHGNRGQTLILAGPAILFALLVTFYVVYEFIAARSNDPDLDTKIGFREFAGVWIIMAGPAFVASLLAVCILWMRRSKIKS